MRLGQTLAGIRSGRIILRVLTTVPEVQDGDRRIRDLVAQFVITDDDPLHLSRGAPPRLIVRLRKRQAAVAARKRRRLHIVGVPGSCERRRHIFGAHLSA